MPEEKRPAGRIRRMWEYNIKIDLEIMKASGDIGWIHPILDREKWELF
jgi:hypothetical protein